MNQPLRIFLRFLALVVFLGSVGATVAIIAIGPQDVADAMGRSCSHDGGTSSEHCSWRDALGLLEAFPYTCLVAAVGLVLLSPRAAGPDEREHRPSRFGDRAGVAGAAVVVLTVVAMFPTVYLYRAGYHVKWTADTAKEIKRAGEHMYDAKPRPKPALAP